MKNHVEPARRDKSENSDNADQPCQHACDARHVLTDGEAVWTWAHGRPGKGATRLARKLVLHLAGRDKPSRRIRMNGLFHDLDERPWEIRTFVPQPPPQALIVRLEECRRRSGFDRIAARDEVIEQNA